MSKPIKVGVIRCQTTGKYLAPDLKGFVDIWPDAFIAYGEDELLAAAAISPTFNSEWILNAIPKEGETLDLDELMETVAGIAKIVRGATPKPLYP